MPNVPPAETHTAIPLWRRPGTLPWVVVLARCLVGGVFVVAGFSKLLLPRAEVAAMLLQYTVLPESLLPLIAAGLPWLELVSGTALAVGFCTTAAACLVGVQLLGFSALMLVVLGMGIRIEDCGCFGNLGLHETPLQVLGRDLVMLLLLIPILTRRREVWSFDALEPPEASP